MAGKTSIIVLILVAAVAVAAAAVVLSMPSEDPEKITDPEEPWSEDLYPKGISFDEKTGTLKSKSSVVWSITDELKLFKERDKGEVTGTSVKLDPGLYTVTVNGESFMVVVDGTHTNTVKWKYYFNGQNHDVSVTFGIDIRELAGITVENRKNNSSISDSFSNLPSLVYVDDTVRSIVSQMRDIFTEIGGDPNDKQAFADFLVSFAQLGIKYPSLVDSSGRTQSADAEVWGENEYWAISLETLFFLKGDCEDSAAVACSLFKAAGYATAMVGVPGHVTASVVLDSFTEVPVEDIKVYNRLYASSVAVAAGHSVFETDPQDVTYYGVDTTKNQLPVGYMLRDNVSEIGNSTLWWGTVGFYPVA